MRAPRGELLPLLPPHRERAEPEEAAAEGARAGARSIDRSVRKTSGVVGFGAW